MSRSNAAARVEAAKRARSRESLDAFIARQPGLGPVPHLAPLVDALEAAERDGDARLVVSAPPGHAKSTTVAAWIARRLVRTPARRVILASYAGQIARSHSRMVRAMALADGCPIDPSQRAAREWRTDEGGGLLAAGIGAAATGARCDDLVIDDHTASRMAAESAAERERTLAWFGSVARTRLEPHGNVVIVATRWSPHDLSAHAIALGYREIALPAIDDDGCALWPARYSAAALTATRDEIGEYDFNALYQGRPTSRASAMFTGLATVEPSAVPANLTVAIGCDLAYSIRTSADSSVAVVLGRASDRRVYVLDVVRRQVRAEDFAVELAALCERWNATAHWHASAMESNALGGFMRERGVRLQTHPAREDKLIRATPAAAAWNAGRIVVVSGAPWCDPFVREVLAFGPGARRDDQIDALASAHGALLGSAQSGESVLLRSSRPSILGVASQRGRAGPW